MKTVVLIETGIANIASVKAAFERLNVEIIQSNNPRTISDAPYAVLPGVGAFGPGMEALNRFSVASAIQERVSKNLPTLAICLGMQLLFEASEESPNIKGLGIFPGSVKKLPTTLPLPHLSWQRIQAEQGFENCSRGWAYFAHSYGVLQAPAKCEVLMSEYGLPFVAAFRKEQLLACQFHPELSGSFGKTILREFLS
jgi:glutamine amidotransferase